jgi:fumarylacetoacetate (FAA) hydrolase
VRPKSATIPGVPPRLRLATRAHGRPDGELVLVDPSLARCAAVPHIARTLQAALDDWTRLAPALDAARAALDASAWRTAEPFDARAALAPLPRAYQFADASVYRNHARLMARWRGLPIPPRYEEEPLVYQGGSDVILR